MKKVLFLTNVIRRMGMMQQMLQKLQKENKLNSNCACHWITEQTVWDKSWEEKLKNTDFLLLKWMGAGIDTPFLQRCISYLKQNKIKYFIDAEGAEKPQLTYGITDLQAETIKKIYNVWRQPQLL